MSMLQDQDAEADHRPAVCPVGPGHRHSHEVQEAHPHQPRATVLHFGGCSLCWRDWRYSPLYTMA